MSEFCPLHNEIQHTITEHATQLGYTDAKIQSLCNKHDELMSKLDALHLDYQESKALLRETNMLVRKMNGNSQITTTTTTTSPADPNGTGVTWFLNKSWNGFVEKWSWMLIVFILWAIAKWLIFGEIPIPFK